MRKFGKKKLIIFVGLLVVGILVPVGIEFLELKGKQDELQKKLALVYGVREISKIWELPNQDQIENCPLVDSKREVNPLFYRCNPSLITCLLKKGVSFHYQKKTFKLLSSKEPMILSKSKDTGPAIPDYGYQYQVHLEGEKTVLPVTLEPGCHDLFLPKKVYGYGPVFRKKKDYLWDNAHQSIYIDRYPVTFNEFMMWREGVLKKFGFTLPKGASKFDWAYGMPLTEMRLFCANRGKELMSAQVFDAASFLIHKNGERIFRGKNPYGRSRKQNLKKVSCSRMMSKECLGKSVPLFDTDSATWMGMTMALGGLLEAMENPIDPTKNIKTSSIYFDRNSSWHELGKRVHWRGEGFLLSDVDFPLDDFRLLDGSGVRELKITFRCMKREAIYE